MSYYLQKAIECIREVENEKAVKMLQDVLKENTDNAEVYRLLGLAYFNLGKYTEAKFHWEKCVDLESSHHQTWWNLGQLYDVIRDFKKAHFAYCQAADLTEKDLPKKAANYREWAKKAQNNLKQNAL